MTRATNLGARTAAIPPEETFADIEPDLILAFTARKIEGPKSFLTLEAI